MWTNLPSVTTLPSEELAMPPAPVMGAYRKRSTHTTSKPRTYHPGLVTFSERQEERQERHEDGIMKRAGQVLSTPARL